jgi:hypothetical protein
MATRNLKSEKNVTFSIITSDKDYLNCDVPEVPFGLVGFVSFWYEDSIFMIPLKDVEKIIIREDK